MPTEALLYEVMPGAQGSGPDVFGNLCVSVARGCGSVAGSSCVMG